MSVARVLGIASAGRVAALLAIVAAASAAGGFWAGQEWQRGKVAQAQVIDLRADANTLRNAVADLRQQSVNAAQDMRIAAARMDAISLDHWRQLDALDNLYTDQRATLDAQIASAAAADLRACRIGAFGLQLWAAAAAGHPLASTGAADADTGPAADRLPGRTADADAGHGRGSDAGVDRSGADVPPLPGEPGGAGGGGVDL